VELLTNLRWETHKQDVARVHERGTARIGARNSLATIDWDDASEGAVEEIAAVNKRRKAGGWYLGEGELREALLEVWERSLRRASREAHGGRYTARELGALVPRAAILAEGMRLIREGGGSLSA
jgi:hypothetical protein